MTTNRQLRIELLKNQQEFVRKTRQILLALSKIDPQACLFSIDKAVANRTMVKKLWELIPEEQDSYQINGMEPDQMIAFIAEVDLNQKVTLHLGWDLFSFECTFKAAWFAWDHFNTIDTDTYNACIFPPNPEWFIIRAGNNLYPMVFKEGRFVLAGK